MFDKKFYPEKKRMKKSIFFFNPFVLSWLNVRDKWTTGDLFFRLFFIFCINYTRSPKFYLWISEIWDFFLTLLFHAKKGWATHKGIKTIFFFKYLCFNEFDIVFFFFFSNFFPFQLYFFYRYYYYMYFCLFFFLQVA